MCERLIAMTSLCPVERTCTESRSVVNNAFGQESWAKILHSFDRRCMSKADLDENNNLFIPSPGKNVKVKEMKEERDILPPLLSPDFASKRHVHFADFDGQDLVSVKIITPANSEEDLSGCRTVDILNNAATPILLKRFKCCFTQPASEEGFNARVIERNVCLENAVFCGFAMTGTVKVKNIAFAKEVTVRYTVDGWQSYRDIWADYVPKSSDGETDRFQFRISIPQDVDVGGRLEFAIRYRTAGKEYWDNNFQRNYCAECFLHTIVDK